MLTTLRQRRQRVFVVAAVSKAKSQLGQEIVRIGPSIQLGGAQRWKLSTRHERQDDRGGYGRPIEQLAYLAARDDQPAIPAEVAEEAQLAVLVEGHDWHPGSYGVGDFEQAAGSDVAGLVGEDGQEVQAVQDVGPALQPLFVRTEHGRRVEQAGTGEVPVQCRELAGLVLAAVAADRVGGVHLERGRGLAQVHGLALVAGHTAPARVRVERRTDREPQAGQAGGSPMAPLTCGFAARQALGGRKQAGGESGVAKVLATALWPSEMMPSSSDPGNATFTPPLTWAYCVRFQPAPLPVLGP